MPRVRHSLLIRHPIRDAILLMRDESAYVLPTVVTEDRHTAEVDHINAAVEAELGIATTFLRSVFHDDRSDVDPVDRRHELMARTVELPRETRAAWWGLDVLPTLAPELVDATTMRPPSDGRDWEHAAWWHEATEWIERILAERGLTAIEIIQLRAWPSSSVLRVRTGVADFYFKAVPESLARECGVTAYLAAHFPDCMPALVAQDHARRWFFMRATPGRKLEDVDTLEYWERAAHTYGRLQVATRRHVEALNARGARIRDLSQLAAELHRLAGERGDVGDHLVALQAHLDELAGYAIPLTIEHGDLWPGNFILDAEQCVIIDWEEAAIGHPFFSMAPFLVGLRTYQPSLATAAATDRILAAYLEAFADLESPGRLRAALDHAIPLAFCDMALRYDQQPASMVRLHPWMRDLVPEAIQRAVSALKKSKRNHR